jgi:hypothetical protein
MPHNGNTPASSGLLANSMGVPTGQHGEHRLNTQQIWALENMFEGNPAVKAARTVLSGQLLSGGISLSKSGKDVKLTPEFTSHLNEVWIPFAQDIIDAFLKWGIAVVSYEEESEREMYGGMLSARMEQDVRQAKRSRRNDEETEDKQYGKNSAYDNPPSIVPIVPALGTYEIAFRMGGRSGYKREYHVYSTSPSTGSKPDDEVRVVVRQHPDLVGNVNSPLASVFELGSFVAAITELAITAEAARARPRMVTQMRKKDSSALDAGNLFFDSETRGMQSSANEEESADQARALQMQHQMCAMINRLQTTSHSDQSGSKKAIHKTNYSPPEIQPSLFHLPKDHEIAPGQSNPESRGDLEALTRLSIEQFSASFGVPSDLIFSGRFAGKSTSQLSLLNVTVSQLAKSVNSVLTMAYKDIYATRKDEDVGQLHLLTSPLAATDEVLALYNGGLVPINIAMPSVMHAIGANKAEIDAAVEEALKARKAEDSNKKQEQDHLHKSNTISLQGQQVELDRKRNTANTPNTRED